MSTPIAFAAAAPSGTPAQGPPPSLERAYLELMHPPSGGLGRPGAGFDTVGFQFNPNELEFTKAARWRRSPQRNTRLSGVPQFQGPDPCRLTLEMFFDAADTMDDSVVTSVEKLFTCVVPTDKSLANSQSCPPWVVLRWGLLNGFTAFVSDVTARFTLFTPGGLPIRAVCTVTLEEIAGVPQKQNPTSGGLGAFDVHVVVAGESLAAVAYRTYGDPALWRALARTNGIDDPMRLRPGARLVLPTVEELTRGH
ncbi:LysM peptidoglycan-binding domain-containing protein [Nonomuraea longicatena]|uniref:LysM peptidoglycan-binding domain-containing protein n=1 Tax=Nonomuraea longicatena TaxID=83682 RepID=A0ABN1NTL0_9ACTN